MKRDAEGNYDEPNAKQAKHAAPLVLLKAGSTLAVSDVQDFALHKLLDTPGPTWVRVEAEVSRVMVIMLCGLDHSLWSEHRDSLTTLRDCFQPPERVYGAAANATTAQCVLSFMQCKQPYARRKDAKADPTKRKNTSAVQRAPSPHLRCARRLTHKRRTGLDKAAPLPFPPTYYQARNLRR